MSASKFDDPVGDVECRNQGKSMVAMSMIDERLNRHLIDCLAGMKSTLGTRQCKE
jgi:hypothetical protein